MMPKPTFRPEKPETYDITITVRGRGGTTKVKLAGIPREKIMAPDYPAVLRQIVESHEYFMPKGEPV